jgi:hypothetical protein
VSRGPVINVTITGDQTGLDRAFKKAADGVNGFSGSLKRVFNEKIIGGAFDLAAQAAQNAFNFATEGVGKFDELGDAISVLDADFKGLGDTVTGIDLTKLGFDKIETATAAKDIADTAKALGLSGDEAAKIVPALTEAAAGYSALTGKDAATSGDLFAKALSGSSKAAKELGVEFKKGMTPAQRMQALMAKWGPLADDAANGTRSLSDEQATFDAQMTNIQTTVGSFINTALTPLMAGLNNTLFPALASFTDQYGPQINAVMGTVGEVFSAVFGFVIDKVVPIVMTLVGAIGDALTPVLEDVGPALQPWIDLFGELFDFIAKNVVPILVESVVPILGDLLDVIVKVAGAVGNVLLQAFKTIKPVLETIYDIFRQVWKVISDVIHGIATAPIVGDFFNWVSGGSGNRSGAGSAARSGTAPVVINFNGIVGDPVRTGREVSRVLGAYRSRGGTIGVY